MTTVNLELSRQLQERWPESDRTDFVWRLDIPSGASNLLTWKEQEADNYRFRNSPSAARYRSENVFYNARTLDELRVFALELIQAKNPYSIRESWSVDREDELKDALIQGCDPTAEWLLMTFGQGGQESE